jgi:hypothetical protein
VMVCTLVDVIVSVMVVGAEVEVEVVMVVF